MSKVSFNLGFQSELLKHADVPIEIRKPNMALIARTFASTNFELKPGSYFVTAKMPAGHELFSKLEIAGDEAVVVDLLDDEQPISATQEIHSYFSSHADIFRRQSAQQNVMQATAPEEPKATKLRICKLPAPGVAVLQFGPLSDGEKIDDQNVHFVIPGQEAPLMLQIIRDGETPINVALPASPAEPCHVTACLIGNRFVVDVHVDHPEAELLLRYCQNGYVAPAASVLRSSALQAELLLRDKMEKPIAAAVGAYALLRLNELERLRDWTANLHYNFRWLPDAALIHAEHLARMGKHKDALLLFLETSATPLPIFTDGLSYLWERLVLYSSAKDFDSSARERAKAEIERIQPFVTWVDFKQPVVSYHGLDPGHPDRTLVPAEAIDNAYDLNAFWSAATGRARSAASV